MKRSLLFNFVSKNLSSLKTNFFQFPHFNAIDILNELLLQYNPLEVEELLIEDQELIIISDELKEKIEQFKNVESLGLNRCKLVTLKNMPDLPRLQRLSLDGNKIRCRHLQYLQKYKRLCSLSVNSNRFEKSEFPLLIKFLNTQKIIQLNIFNNNISKNKSFHQDIFNETITLIQLDNLQSYGNEVFYQTNGDPKLELERNDTEDQQYIRSIIKKGKANEFEWAIDEKPKLEDIQIKQKKVSQNNSSKKKNKSDFQMEKEIEDESDEEFEINEEEMNDESSLSEEMDKNVKQEIEILGDEQNQIKQKKKKLN